jgi:hypothetical protein
MHFFQPRTDLFEDMQDGYGGVKFVIQLHAHQVV